MGASPLQSDLLSEGRDRVGRKKRKRSGPADEHRPGAYRRIERINKHCDEWRVMSQDGLLTFNLPLGVCRT